MHVRVDGEATGDLVRVFNFASLADVEAWRAGIDIDSEYARKRDALLSRPLQSTIREVLIQFPMR